MRRPRDMEVRSEAGVVCEQCRLADTPWRRLRGLLGRRALPVGEGLLLRRTGSIHTFFMRFPIDAVFLDREDVVVRVVGVAPWRIAGARGARSVLELPAGESVRRGIAQGARLSLH